MCVSGSCRMGACNPGYGDCNGSTTDGCETNLNLSASHCGRCGNACVLERATAECASGSCRIAACAAGFGDCDRNDATGCEQRLDTLEHCGACGTACMRANATATCASGSCRIASCNPGYADCNRSDADGCEVRLGTNAHCGGCGMSCAATERCVVDRCVPRATELAAGMFHSCARLSDGTVRCWGANGSGQLGDGTTMDRSTPVAVAGLTGVVAVVAGGEHTCALVSSGPVRCWGSNVHGQLGDGTTVNRLTPVELGSLGSVVAIAAGGNHTCALHSDGGVSCWGRNNAGQLGNGSTISRSSPSRIKGLTGAVAITAGLEHTCVVFGSGSAQCWGYNVSGQVGDGTTVNRPSPVPVMGLSAALAIAGGGEHSCARDTSGRLHCWGNNVHGQIGDGTTMRRLTPVLVSGISGTPTFVDLGIFHSCSLFSGGVVRCWGGNAYGQIGDGTTTSRSMPTVTIGSGVTALAAGGLHNCALLTDGRVRCWGANTSGQLGDGTTMMRTSPVTVSGL
ncbi:MAG: hypothetical protein RMK74_13665 [Myxococcales bacterium]|nr:hypothetical protein [Myxococcales bacterium]